MFKSLILLVVLLFSVVSKLYSDELHMADGHGPISLMGDHIHKKGEVMFSYRFGHMKMNNIMNGTKNLRIDEVTSRPNSASNGSGVYMNSPISMKMDMHMFGVMYAPLDQLTLMIMTSYLEKEMTQQRMPMTGSARFDVNSSGIGDTRVSGLIKLYNGVSTKTHFGIGLSLPTGSIDKRDSTPVSSDARLGYAMQNGSGSFDPYFLINNVNSIGRFKIGQQFIYKTSISGKNSKDYNYGDNYNATLWSSVRWADNLSTSAKINYDYREKMHGSDNEMNPRMSPSMDSYNQGHQKINLGLGVNLINHNNFLKNHRLGIEGTIPLYQRYKGLQMKEIFRLTIGWQYGF